MKKNLILFFVFIASPIFCTTAEKLKEHHTYAFVYNYEKSPYVSDEVWEMVQPYLLPSNHPLKAKLDAIFKKSRVTENQQSVKKAGFTNPKERQFSHCTISPHPKLKNYYVKMYTDDYPNVDDYNQWIKRIEGVKSINKSIKKHGYQRMFKTPKKWIYPLPAEPSPANPTYRKNFILIAQDMHIYSINKNNSKWRGSSMTKQKIDALYTIMQENGLSDSIYPFNVPFCKDGRLAFIDTEYHHRWPISFDKMLKYFSPQMGEYWLGLINKGG